METTINIKTMDEFSEYILTELGSPVINLEIKQEHVIHSIKKAITFYVDNVDVGVIEPVEFFNIPIIQDLAVAYAYRIWYRIASKYVDFDKINTKFLKSQGVTEAKEIQQKIQSKNL